MLVAGQIQGGGIGFGFLIQRGGMGFGFFIGDGAVGEVVLTKLGARRNIRHREVSRGDRVGIDLAGGGILRVGQRSGRRDKQWRAGRRQRRAPSQRRLWFFRCAHGKRRHRLQLWLERCNVHTGADEEQVLRVGLQPVQAGDHPGQFGSSVDAGDQLFVDIADGTVGGVDDGQRRRVGFHEQQGGVGVAGSAAHHLRQRGRSHEGRDQHDVLDLAGGQRLAQGGSVHRVGPGHSGRCQRIAGLRGAFPSAQDRRDHLIGCAQGCCIVIGDDVEIVVVDRDAVGVFAFHQHHTNGCGCHR